jgi:hypothetical protein
VPVFLFTVCIPDLVWVRTSGAVVPMHIEFNRSPFQPSGYCLTSSWRCALTVLSTVSSTAMGNFTRASDARMGEIFCGLISAI